MRFSDYVIEYALQVNTDCLVALGGREPVSSAGVHALRVNVKRLRAAWELLKPCVDSDIEHRAKARLTVIHKALAESRDRDVLLETTRKLVATKCSRKLESTLAKLLAGLSADSATRPIDLHTVEVAFEVESRYWRELEPRDLPLRDVVELGFGGSFRRARKLGKRALRDPRPEVLHACRRHVKHSLYQLEVVRPVLGEANLARRWYMDRLADTLGRHQDLHMLEAYVPTSGLKPKDVKRVLAYVAERKSALTARAVKLVPHLYGQKTKDYIDDVFADVASLAVGNLLLLPRRAG